MKKRRLLLLCAALLAALLIGCTPQTPPNPIPPVSEDAAPPPADGASTDGAATDIAPAQTRAITLYLPNDNADGFDQLTATVTEDPQAILDALITNDALAEGTKLNSFTMLDDQAHIDLDISAAFQESLQSTGTAGERMYMGSLVNTLLTAYGCQTITITCDGGPIETGHEVYDQPMEFYD